MIEGASGASVVRSGGCRRITSVTLTRTQRLSFMRGRRPAPGSLRSGWGELFAAITDCPRNHRSRGRLAPGAGISPDPPSVKSPVARETPVGSHTEKPEQQVFQPRAGTGNTLVFAAWTMNCAQRHKSILRGSDALFNESIVRSHFTLQCYYVSPASHAEGVEGEQVGSIISACGRGRCESREDVTFSAARNGASSEFG